MTAEGSQYEVKLLSLASHGGDAKLKYSTNFLAVNMPTKSTHVSLIDPVTIKMQDKCDAGTSEILAATFSL